MRLEVHPCDATGWDFMLQETEGRQEYLGPCGGRLVHQGRNRAAYLIKEHKASVERSTWWCCYRVPYPEISNGLVLIPNHEDEV